jgi:tryptophan synthase alpha chain
VRFDHREMLATLRDANAPPPIFGFGISRPDHVRAALDAGAAGVVCGSAIVSLAAAGGDVRGFVASLKAATRQARAA